MGVLQNLLFPAERQTNTHENCVLLNLELFDEKDKTF